MKMEDFHKEDEAYKSAKSRFTAASIALSQINDELGASEESPLGPAEQMRLSEAEAAYDEAREALDLAKADLKVAMGKDPLLAMLANERNPEDELS